MDFKDKIKELSERIEKLKDSIQTEEATKTALIMPFIQILGYDVFNPFEVIPEMVCDIGTKKGEKIDYCIQKDGEPIILIECKHWEQDLTLHDNQLLRYFHVSKAKFGVLTNGIVYRFYTDLADKNKMDEVPFLEVNMLQLKEVHMEELKKFHKSYFNLDEILNAASELKYMGELRKRISEEFRDPSNEFVKLLAKPVYGGAFTPKVLEQFTDITKRTISTYINDIISERLNVAISKSEAISREQSSTPTPPNDAPRDKSEIITTEEELEAYRIVKAILAKHISPERVFYRDAVNYFTVIIDDNNRKNVCRLYLNVESNKRMRIVRDDKTEDSYQLDSIESLYNLSDELIASALRYL